MAEKKNLSFSNIDVPIRDEIVQLINEAAEMGGYGAANAWVENELANVIRKSIDKPVPDTISSDVKKIKKYLNSIDITLESVANSFGVVEENAAVRYQGTLVRQQEKLDAVEVERDELKKDLSAAERRAQEAEMELASAIKEHELELARIAEAHEVEVDALEARIEELEANAKGFNDLLAAFRQEFGSKAEA